MKYLILTFILFNVFSAFGQNNNTFPTSGNVGIGTTSPATKLNIISSINDGIRIDNGSNYGHIFNDGNLHIESVGKLWINGNSGSPTIIGNSGGNVGIGNGNPNFKLDVGGDININSDSYYRIGGVLAMYKASHYQVLSDKEGRNAIYLGGESDKANYYDNTTHYFRSRDGQNNYMVLSNGSLSLNGNLGTNGTITSRYNTILHNGSLNFMKKIDSTGHLFFSDSQNNRMIGIRRLLSYEGNDGIGFYGFANNNWTSILTMKDNGSIGVGLPNPNAKFEVYNNTAASSSEFLSKWSFDPNYWWLGLEQQHFGGSHVQWNFKQKNYNNEVDLLSFKLGNVGIGTTNPAAKLEVNGNALIKVAGIPELTIEGTGNANYAGGALQLKSGTIQANDKYNQTTIIMDRGTTGTGMLQIQRRFDNAYNGQLIDYSDISGWRFHTASERTATTTNERFSIKPNGQITIGTATPYSDYKLSVAGNVIADKVKVKKSTNGIWPDFVFSPSYKLPNLTDVENFVRQNSHLPEIPSAAEIEKDGQDLGEMNRLLLKKVEELTLYIINQEKRTDKLQIEILEQRNEITELRKLIRE